MSPVEPRVNQIYREAARLFVQNGFAATSMSDIARAVGITKAGLYHFVTSKDELALNLITWAYDIYDRDVYIPAQGISDPLERLQFIVRGHLYNVGTHRNAAGNPVTLLLDDPAALNSLHRRTIARRKSDYFHFLRTTLAALKARGDLIDIDPTVAAFSLLGQILWLARWHKADGPLSLDEIVAQMTEIALRGVIRAEVLEAKEMAPTKRPAPHVDLSAGVSRAVAPRARTRAR
jgi:AcrR family transcriptional regulator